MNEKNVKNCLSSLERFQEYREKAGEKWSYWQDKVESQYKKIGKELNLFPGDKVVIGDYILFREDRFDSGLKIEKLKTRI